jgi:Heterokaryon incompatibility protein (HET)
MDASQPAYSVLLSSSCVPSTFSSKTISIIQTADFYLQSFTMRLIEVDTFHLTEFIGDEVPRYGILSHRWGNEEVSFECITKSLRDAKRLKGFEKIAKCAAKAKAHGLKYIWVDTCCIDKNSSSELTESINSMYTWYWNSAICYAWLSDVPAKPKSFSFSKTSDHPNSREWETQFQKSEWFRRGWTLQELIAPRMVLFYSKCWNFIESKGEIYRTISKISGIQEDILIGKAELDTVSIGQRMSWASGRTTTRLEDMAYSLMGIFDVNMPLIYGEGQKAFIRLQEEILRKSEDHTLFAWTDKDGDHSSFRSLFASSPAEFQSCYSMIPIRMGDEEPIFSTNRGLLVHLELRDSSPNEMEYIALLRCKSLETKEVQAIRLRRLFPGSNKFARVSPDMLYGQPITIFENQNDQNTMSKLYVPEKMPLKDIAIGLRIKGFQIDNDTRGWKLLKVFPSKLWKEDEKFVEFSPDTLESDDMISVKLVLQNNKAEGGPREHFGVGMFYNPSHYERKIPTSSRAGIISVPAYGSIAVTGFIGEFAENKIFSESDIDIQGNNVKSSKGIVFSVDFTKGFRNNKAIIIAKLSEIRHSTES